MHGCINTIPLFYTAYCFCLSYKPPAPLNRCKNLNSKTCFFTLLTPTQVSEKIGSNIFWVLRCLRSQGPKVQKSDQDPLRDSTKKVHTSLFKTTVLEFTKSHRFKPPNALEWNLVNTASYTSRKTPGNDKKSQKTQKFYF